MSLIALMAAATRGGAQSSTPSPPTEGEFRPEVDYFQELSPNTRVMAQASGVVGDGDILQQEYGLNLDLFLKPKPFHTFILGAASLVEDRHLRAVLRFGYRYQEEPAESGQIGKIQNRLLLEFTGRQALWGTVVADRNGFDWRWTNGAYSTRYRNRLEVQRPVDIGDYELSPYVNAEVIYLLSSGYWNQVRYEAGVQLPVVEHVSAQIYYGRDVVWQPTPGTINALGLQVIVSF